MPRLIPLLVAALLSTTAFAQPAARIARFAGDRAAAISYTFDDGLRDQYTVAVPMLNEVGLKGTFFVIPGKISETIWDAEKRKNDKRAWGTITWDELRSMSAQGHEIASHTWSHTGFTKQTPEQVEEELTKSCDTIKEHIGTAPLTIAFPFNQASPENKAATLKYYVAYRSYQLGTGGKSTAESLNAWADKQVRDKSWGVIMAHGIAYGYAAFSDPQNFRVHLHYVKNLQSDIWVDTFANVARYAKERDDAKLTVTASIPGHVTCVLTGTLDPKTYDVPLTLVLDITGAKSARALRAGHELPVRISASALQVDAVTSTEPLTLTWQ